MLNIYNPRNDDEHLTVTELQEMIQEMEQNDVTGEHILYCYDLLGYLSHFKVTRCGVSCYDSLGNYCYFRDTSKYKFYKLNFFTDYSR